MIRQLLSESNPGETWTIDVPEIHDDPLNAGVIQPDGSDQVIAMYLGKLDAQNARAIEQAKALRQAAAMRLPALERDAARAAKHLGHTRRTHTIATRQTLAELPRFQVFEAGASVVGCIGALAVNNGVLASYVVNSGNELFATDPIGARLFAGLAILAALGFRTYEYFLTSDTARSHYRTVLFGIGICTFMVWAMATAWTFAPSADGASWLTPGTNSGWTGTALVFAHVLGDAAWGYLLIAGAEKILLGNRERIEVGNPHHAEAEAHVRQTQAALAACLGEIAEADAFIAAVAHARIELQARIELELDRRTALWRAQQEAGVAVARAIPEPELEGERHAQTHSLAGFFDQPHNGCVRQDVDHRSTHRLRGVEGDADQCGRGRRPATAAEGPRARLFGADLAPWSALILKLGSVEQETDDEEEPVQRRADHRHPEGAAGRAAGR